MATRGRDLGKAPVTVCPRINDTEVPIFTSDALVTPGLYFLSHACSLPLSLPISRSSRAWDSEGSAAQRAEVRGTDRGAGAGVYREAVAPKIATAALVAQERPLA